MHSFFYRIIEGKLIEIECTLENFLFKANQGSVCVPTFAHIDVKRKKLLSVGDNTFVLGERIHGFTNRPNFEILAEVTKFGVKAVAGIYLVRPRIIFKGVSNLPLDLFKTNLIDPKFEETHKNKLSNPKDFRIRFFQDLGFMTDAREVSIVIDDGETIVAKR